MKTFILTQNTLVQDDSFLPIVSQTISRENALEMLKTLDVRAYAQTRNGLAGGVSKLSVYIEHGLLDIKDFLIHIESSGASEHALPLLRQLYWREFFLQTYEKDPQMIWQDYEPYKTGWLALDYAQSLPLDIQNAKTQIPLIDKIVVELRSSGTLHNHARLYLASYVVHFRRIAWQAGARWMLGLLADGNIAVNNLSWQWVASTRSDKPYIFNWDNIEKFAAKHYDLKRSDHKIFDASYETLSGKLFREVQKNV